MLFATARSSASACAGDAVAARARAICVRVCHRACPEHCGAGISVEYERVEHGSSDLSQVVTTEYRADHVVGCMDGAGDAVAGMIAAGHPRGDQNVTRMRRYAVLR